MSSANRQGKADGRAPRELGEDTRDSGPAPPAQGACGSPAFAGLESDAMSLKGKHSGQILAASGIESTLHLRALACVAIPTSLLWPRTAASVLGHAPTIYVCWSGAPGCHLVFQILNGWDFPHFGFGAIGKVNFGDGI